MYVLTTDYGTPGIRSDIAAGGTREWLYTASPANCPPVLLPGGRVIDGTKARDPLNADDVDVLRPGLLMGKITSSSKYAPAIIGITSNAEAAASVAMEVSVAVATEIVRRIGSSGTFNLTGPPTAAGTVATQTVTFSAVNTSTGVITTSGLSAAAVAGSLIRPTDGSETILGGLDEWVKVTNNSSANQDTRLARLCVSGFAKSSQILNYPADTSLRAWLKAQLNNPTAGPGPFKFDDNF